MKENDFLDSVSNIRSDVVERFVSMDNKLQMRANISKSKGLWLRFAAATACFAVIIGAISVLPMLIDDDPGSVDSPPDNISYTPIIFDATASPEQLSGSNLEFVIGSSSSMNGGSSEPPSFEFATDNFSVRARVVKNLPDEYYKLDVSSEYKPVPYRLIEMETLEVMHGENVPQHFLYMIDIYTFVDMSVYDSLLISMSQLGAEKYVLKNSTQNRTDCFELPIFTDHQGNPELGNIIAFNNGIFDESLWQNENWIYGYQFAKHYLDDPQSSDLVVKRGASERDVINEIRRRIEDWHMNFCQSHSVITLDFKTQAAMDALTYVEPFRQGVFSQRISNNRDQLIFTRYINGCQTEESVTINVLTEEVTHSEIRYTKEDMSRMENISAHLLEKAAEYADKSPTPPHIDPEGKELLCLNLYAWYAKADGKIYGVVKTSWRYRKKDDYFFQYYDEVYVLYDMTESTAEVISREALITLLGTRNVYTYGELGAEKEIPR